jgi:uncharacterized protein (DUF2236 family)
VILIDRIAGDAFAAPPHMPPIDFAAPEHMPALFAADSVAWRIMKNPVALMIGGIAAVLLELAEPRVRTGVWDYTRFREDPVGRMRRTGYAALVTTYAPANAARALIARVSHMHAAIAGRTPTEVCFRADDPELLNWVQATASFGFCEAYHRFVHPLSGEERDAFYAEGAPAAALYGATGAPRSEAERAAMFEAIRPKLEASPIISEFLSIVRAAPILPRPMKPLQNLAARAAIMILPGWARAQLSLENYDLPLGGETTLRTIGRLADHIAVKSAPPAQACLRMGLPATFLYRREH